MNPWNVVLIKITEVVFLSVILVGLNQIRLDRKRGITPDYSSIAATCVVLGCLFVSVSLLAFRVAVEIKFGYSDKTTVESGSVELVTLADSQEQQGRFYLLGGVVNEREYYHYIYVTDVHGETGYRKGKILAENCLVIENDEETPRIVEYLDCSVSGFVNIYREPKVNNVRIVYVPVGSVKKDFSIDINY